MKKTVIIAIWKKNGKIEAFASLTDLFNKYPRASVFMPSVRYSLTMKKEDFENEAVKISRLEIERVR